MGKIKTRILGLEEIEEEQKKQQKEKMSQKKARMKAEKHKIRTPGLKGGERMVAVEVKEKDVEKMEKAKKLIEEKKETKKPTAGKKVKKEKKRGAAYLKAKKAIDKNKKYSLAEAVKLLKKIKYSRFDETVEVHLNVDKVGLKGEVSLPHSTGKKIRVKIVDEKVLADIEKGKLDFDVLVTHPSFMPKLARLARILGPKGLMPNPKAGTISDQPEAVAKKYLSGMLRWKTESKFPLIHQAVGKISFADKQLMENIAVFLKSIGPSHIQSAFIKTTMSPALKLNLEDL